MSGSWSRRIAFTVVVGYPVAVLGAFGLARVAGGGVREDLIGGAPLILPFAAFALVGALIISRHPGNRIGWVCAGIGILLAFGQLAATYGGWGLTRPEPPPATMLGLWIGTWAWFALLGLASVALPLLVPDGRLPSPRWRWVAGFAAVAVGGLVVLGMFSPELYAMGAGTVANPVGSEWVPDPVGSTLSGVLTVGILLSSLAAVTSVIVRYRGGGTVERTQLKWIVYGLVAMSLLSLIADAAMRSVLGSVSDAAGNAIYAVLWMIIPVSIGVAVLRYRLYEIDRIISRTVTYAGVVAVLGGVYVLGILAFGSLLAPLGAGGDLAVAASTLAAAALFQPVVRRVRSFVDRRFDRARYDAERIVESFTQRLRDEVQLEEAAQGVVETVHAALHPAHASVWLPSGTGEP